MDRRQMIVQRVRDIFGEGLDDVLHVVRQDRQEMRGWQEPAPLRAALRRAVRPEGAADAALHRLHVLALVLQQVPQRRHAAQPPLAHQHGGPAIEQ